MQKSDFNSYSTSYSKVNSKWIMELNVKLKTVKLLEDDFGLYEDFLNMTPIL